MQADLWVDFTNNQTLSDADIVDYVADLNTKLPKDTRAVLMGPRLVGRIKVVFSDAALTLTGEITTEELFAEKPPLPINHF